MDETQQINASRVKRFDEYRKTLSDEEQHELNGMLRAIQMKMAERAGKPTNLGVMGAKELLMAVVEFLDKKQVR